MAPANMECLNRCTEYALSSTAITLVIQVCFVSASSRPMPQAMLWASLLGCVTVASGFSTQTNESSQADAVISAVCFIKS